MVIRGDSPSDEMREIPIADIERRPQVRVEFDPAPLDELVASFQAVGQQSPILVRAEGEKYRLIYGERRLRAATLIGWTKVRAIITYVDLTESEILQRQLIENMQRVDLCPLEKAKGIQHLMELDGLKAGVVATRLGVSAATITKTLGLLKLPVAIQEQVASGKIPQSAAYDLSRVESDEERQQLADDLVAGRINRDGLAGAIKARGKTAVRPTNASASTRVTAPLTSGRFVTVAGPSLNLEGFIELLEELLAKARKVRPQGVELGTFIKMLRDQAMQVM